MTQDLAAAAAQILAAKASLQRIGKVAVWGTPEFRPGDAFYKLTSAKAAGGELTLELADLQGGKPWRIILEGAARVSVKPGQLKVGDATGVASGTGKTAKPSASKQPALLITSD